MDAKLPGALSAQHHEWYHLCGSVHDLFCGGSVLQWFAHENGGVCIAKCL